MFFFHKCSLKVLPLCFPSICCFPIFYSQRKSHPGSGVSHRAKQQVLQILASLWSCGSHCLCRVCLGWKLLMKVGILIGRLMGQGYSPKAQQVRKVDPSWWQLKWFFWESFTPKIKRWVKIFLIWRAYFFFRWGGENHQLACGEGNFQELCSNMFKVTFS